MSHHALLEYIRAAKERGADDAAISARLHEAGWYRVDIQDAHELYARLASMPGQTAQAYQPPVVMPRPAPVPQAKMRSYDPRLIAVATLSFVVGFIGYIWLAK